MTEYLLDTNIWIGLARGEAGLQKRLRELRVSQVHCCSVVRAELEFGARKSERVEANSW